MACTGSCPPTPLPGGCSPSPIRIRQHRTRSRWPWTAAARTTSPASSPTSSPAPDPRLLLLPPVPCPQSRLSERAVVPAPGNSVTLAGPSFAVRWPAWSGALSDLVGDGSGAFQAVRQDTRSALGYPPLVRATALQHLLA